MAVERSTSGDRAMKQVGLLVLRMNVVMMVVTNLNQPGLVTAAAERNGGEEVETLKSNLAMIELKVPNLFPEGFDWDEKHNRFLVGSMSQGKLVTVTEDGTVEDFVEDEEYAGASTLGVTVDPTRNRVLVVVSQPRNPNGMSALAAYDLDSKKRAFFVKLLPEEELAAEDSSRSTKKWVANDVAVDGDGNAYVTNSAGNSIWKVTPQGAQSVFIASVPQLPFAVDNEFVKSVTTNGIAFHHEGFLLVAQSNSGAILKVTLADKQVHAVKISDGAGAGDGAVMPAADGIALRSDGSLAVVSTHTAWLMSSRDSWRSATLIAKALLDSSVSTTGVAVRGLDVFAIHSHFMEHFRGVDCDSFKILEVGFGAEDDSEGGNSPLWLLAIFGAFAVSIAMWKLQMSQFNKQYTKKRV